VYAGDIFSQMIMGNLVHTSTVLIRRERLQQVHGFNEDLRHSAKTTISTYAPAGLAR